MYVSFQTINNILIDDRRPAILHYPLSKGLELLSGLLKLANTIDPLLKIILQAAFEYLLSQLIDFINSLGEIMKELNGFINRIALYEINKLY